MLCAIIRTGVQITAHNALNVPGQRGAREGNRLKYKAERVEALLNHIKLGVPIVHACAAVGINQDTYHRWKKKYEDFESRVKEAESHCLKMHVSTIYNAAKGGDAKAAQWWLERRHPKDFGHRQAIDVNAEMDGKKLTMQAVIESINKNGGNGSGE